SATACRLPEAGVLELLARLDRRVLEPDRYPLGGGEVLARRDPGGARVVLLALAQLDQRLKATRSHVAPPKYGPSRRLRKQARARGISCEEGVCRAALSPHGSCRGSGVSSFKPMAKIEYVPRHRHSCVASHAPGPPRCDARAEDPGVKSAASRES